MRSVPTPGSSPEAPERSSRAYLARLLDEAQTFLASNPIPEALGLCDPEFAEQLSREARSPSGGCHDLQGDLEKKPKFQELLALAVNYSPSKWLLEQEQPFLRERRRLCRIHTETPESGERDPYVWAATNRVRGACLSGGGIRSATFNLGILQGLARLGHLNEFDYLSSVSGGGYIHQFLAAWIQREEKRVAGERKDNRSPWPPRSAYSPGDGLREVVRQLDPLPNEHGVPFHPEPIKWLRRYSNYLTPAKGIGSADMWVAIAIWLRNVFLNQLVLLSGLFTQVLLLRIAARPLAHPFPTRLLTGLVCATVLMVSAYLGVALYREYVRTRKQDLDEACDRRHQTYVPWSVLNWDWIGSNGAARWLGVAPFLLVSYLSLGRLRTWQMESYWKEVGSVVLASLTVMGLVTTFSGGAWREYATLDDRSPVELTLGGIWVCVYSAALAAFMGTLTFLGFWWLLGGLTWQVDAVFGPALLLSVPFLTLIFGAGLVGRDFPDWIREWLGRLRAWSLMLSGLWIVVFALVLLGPWLIPLVPSSLQSSITWSSVLAWVAATGGSLLAGTSGKTPGRNDEAPRGWGLELLALAGPYAYILGVMLLLCHAAAAVDWYWDLEGVVLASVVSFAVFVIFGLRVDINAFSLNTFYRNRLTRCYLGATNPDRKPSPLTGFDDRDTRGLQISRLLPRWPTEMFPEASEAHKDFIPYAGPFPIICTTLNLTFGEDLAWQERKAASFAFTPLYSGYTVGWTAGRRGDELSFNGFVPTLKYGFPNGGINIATAVAISGAAASPNWGYHTNPGTAFLMTMFDARLGWWIVNPRTLPELAGAATVCEHHHTDRPTPKFAPWQLWKELLGMTGDTSKYVYLSDGGHFDNLGLYELVRRRCYRILICDGEEDANYVFDGLGMAIRRCRIDFGVEITLSDLKEVRLDGDTNLSHAHFAYGTIRYPEAKGDGNGENEGQILYLKSSLTGARTVERQGASPATLPTEPADILNYKLEHGAFPHDTTLNQWFTESQFESYRRLGCHVVEEMEVCGLWKRFFETGPATLHSKVAS
jgi:hypothetical protein